MTAVARIIEAPPEVSILTTGYPLPSDIPYSTPNGLGGAQWQDGVRFNYICNKGYGWQLCPPNAGLGLDGPFVSDPASLQSASFEPFVMYFGESCGWLGKPSSTTALQAVLADAETLAPALMADQLWDGSSYTASSGVSGGVFVNPTLQTSASILSSTAVAPELGIARLIEAMRNATGGKGGIIIHGTEVLVQYLSGRVLLQKSGGRYLGKGFAYSPGPNNPGDTGGAHGPIVSGSASTQAAGEAWLYATMKVEWGMGPWYSVADSIGSPPTVDGVTLDPRIYFDPRTNLWKTQIMRLGILRFNPCAVFATKVYIPSSVQGT